MKAHVSLALALVPGLLAACIAEEPAEDETPAPVGGERVARPSRSIALPNGNDLRFYVWDDSVGVLEVGQSSVPSVYELGDLEEASPAELFWAATADEEVPAELVRQHEDLARDGERDEWSAVASAHPRGWLLAELEARAASGGETASLADCANATFTANHCLPDANYTNDKCFLDRSSNVTWISALSRRYKAGVCVSQGFIHDKLTYQEVTGYCGGLQDPVTIWDQNYSPGGYTTWTWWGQPTRQWRHSATNAGAGDVFDHGQKWQYYECVP